ncbi:hypothetical protein LguiA_027133 [Lonicera macranthoides]
MANTNSSKYRGKINSNDNQEQNKARKNTPCFCGTLWVFHQEGETLLITKNLHQFFHNKPNSRSMEQTSKDHLSP